MYAERILRLPAELRQRAELLASRGLSVPGSGGPGSVLGLFEDLPSGEERLVATGALMGRVIQGVAVREELDGQGLTSTLLGFLIQRAADAGIWHLFLFTRPRGASRFTALGFRPVAETESAVLLEWGKPGIEEFLNGLKRETEHVCGSGGCVVVNCNPFTLGHRYLIETAAKKSGRLCVVVVGEDRSEFPFDVRFQLVRDGVADLDNVVVLSGGDYVVSSATFPSYFTKEEEFASVHATLDLTIFAERIAPALSATRRFVGTEPFSPVTNVYNETMKRLLPQYGIAVEEMDRLRIDGAPVSASRVRALLRQGNIEGVRNLVPSTTWRWLASSVAAPVLERLRTV
ncbi:MAG: [citrate (pro-3S)-lyase] ligase [Synergistaceae bacterium]|jgi:[citrate (pro-3S)-lyase] ligase|nr:[citrate (pro-3S)-lyase] ligase [Synergistaceae bacterium]